MHMRSGFSLIEFLIATAIAALLASFLFAIVQQTNKTVRSVDAVTELQLRAILLQHQLEHDLSGACIPFTVVEALVPEKKQPEKAQPTGQKKVEKPSATEKPLTEKEQKKAPKIEKVFYATTKGKQANLLTCITNNPLPTVAWLTGAAPIPALVRVVYRLKEETNLHSKTPLYSLWWQESANLSFDAYNEGGAIREYELVTGIKEFSCTFIALKVDNNSNDKKESEVIESADWNHEKQDKDKQKDQNQERLVPHAVEVKVVLTDAGMKRTETFNFTIPIFPDFMMTIPQEEEEKKELGKPPLSGAPGQKPLQGAAKTGSTFESAGFQVPATLKPKTWNQPASSQKPR